MFVSMEQDVKQENPEELLTWYEILDLIVKGKKREIVEGESTNGVYAAIRKFDKKKKEFTIRTHPVSKKIYVIRIK